MLHATFSSLKPIHPAETPELKDDPLPLSMELLSPTLKKDILMQLNSHYITSGVAKDLSGPSLNSKLGALSCEVQWAKSQCPKC